MTRLLDDPFALAVLALLAKATLVVAAGGVITALPPMRRASAATRHMIWMMAVAALLALPALSALLPAWRVVELAAPRPASGATQSWTPAPDPTPAAKPSTRSETPAPTPEARPPAAPTDPGSGWRAVPVWAWLLIAYLAGAAILLAQVLLGRAELNRLMRTAHPAGDRWAQLLRELTWSTAVDRPVTLLRSDRAAMPMTWGTLRPCILLPGEADAWPAERRRVVLLHELAHVARRDCLAQTLAAVVCALYWIHPGVWYAARRMRVERELACDDRVLAAGTRARAYAGHLLEVARAFSPVRRVGAVAVSMARPSQLEGRMLAVLDELRSRRSPAVRDVLTAGVAALLLLMPLAAAQAGPAAKTAAPPPEARLVERTLPARPAGTLVMDLQTGGAVEVVGWDEDSVFVHADLVGSDAERVQISIEGDGRNARVFARHPAGTRSDRHAFQVRVPSRYDVRVVSRGGGVSIRDVDGRVSGSTGGDGLHLARIHGFADFRTEGGGALVVESHLDGSLRTDGAGVWLQASDGDLAVPGGSVVRSDAPPAAGHAQALAGDLGRRPRPDRTARRGQREAGRPATGASDSWTVTVTPTPRTTVTPRTTPRRDGTGFAYATGRDGKERARGVEALARNAPAAAAAMALIRFAFEDGDPEVQREAARSLVGLAEAAGLEGLIQVAHTHRQAALRAIAAQGLGQMACDDAIAALRTVIADDASREVKLLAVRALGATIGRTEVDRRIRPEQIRQILRDVAREHPDAAVRARAAAELSERTAMR